MAKINEALWSIFLDDLEEAVVTAVTNKNGTNSKNPLSGEDVDGLCETLESTVKEYRKNPADRSTLRRAEQTLAFAAQRWNDAGCDEDYGRIANALVWGLSETGRHLAASRVAGVVLTNPRVGTIYRVQTLCILAMDAQHRAAAFGAQNAPHSGLEEDGALFDARLALNSAEQLYPAAFIVAQDQLELAALSGDDIAGPLARLFASPKPSASMSVNELKWYQRGPESLEEAPVLISRLGDKVNELRDFLQKIADQAGVELIKKARIADRQSLARGGEKSQGRRLLRLGLTLGLLVVGWAITAKAKGSDLDWNGGPKLPGLHSNASTVIGADPSQKWQFANKGGCYVWDSNFALNKGGPRGPQGLDALYAAPDWMPMDSAFRLPAAQRMFVNKGGASSCYFADVIGNWTK